MMYTGVEAEPAAERRSQPLRCYCLLLSLTITEQESENKKPGRRARLAVGDMRDEYGWRRVEKSYRLYGAVDVSERNLSMS
jgi:hypothetical protein